MGLLNWFGKRGAARALARSAHETYLKYKTNDPNLSEAEIAKTIFTQRCSLRNLNKTEQIRFKEYLETGDEVDSLLKLCLAMIHILLNITEADGIAHQTLQKIIEEELTLLGHKIPSV